jgi:hypothetical protein
MAGCNPYPPYEHTHLNILAAMDPSTGYLEVNMQMVFMAKSYHADSIAFRLNKDFRVVSLSAQELVRYEHSPEGDLVLYIQEDVPSGDRLHISLSYEGYSGFVLEEEENMHIDSVHSWLPFHEDLPPMTYRMEFRLPQGYKILNPDETKASVGLFTMEETMPVRSLTFSIRRITD